MNLVEALLRSKPEAEKVTYEPHIRKLANSIQATSLFNKTTESSQTAGNDVPAFGDDLKSALMSTVAPEA